MNACCAVPATGVSRCQGQDKKAPPPNDARRVRYRIDEIDCRRRNVNFVIAAEAMTGVVRLDLDLIARELTTSSAASTILCHCYCAEYAWIWPS